MTVFVLLAAVLCVLALAWLTRPWWWPVRVLDESTPPQRPSSSLAVGLSGFVLLIAAGGYTLLGTPSRLGVGPDTAASAAASAAAEQASLSSAAQQVEGMVNQLAERLKAKPDDVEGWRMLGRSYVALERHAQAAEAFAKASQLRPNDATLMVDHAFSMAMANQRSFAGEPSKLIARALTLEPKNPKVLALAGTAAFDRKDYAASVALWEQLAQIEPAGSPFAEQIQASIAQARQLAGMASPATPVADKAATAPAQVSGTVKLAPALKAKVAPDDTLFVFARAVEGPRMPLAIIKVQAKNLPLKFTLDDTMAMSPAAKLSGVSRVIVGARISKSGNATPQSGDLQGVASDVAVGTRGLEIEITEELKR